ncbi:glycosyltransferase [Caulobacter segnis]|uniref:glycosyltransferase n=1 Tax=Caulobacter segnis TaxID=88688 RepID=UPI00240FD08D|nr:nucleotide disphospho-sugar-binding domain-containing protein [Caulobacter segnis]MDG2520615.1 glycosyltransferase [Caulobacter segnis]
MRFLFTTFEGGGHVPPPLAVASALTARGHEVLFVSDEANRAAAEASGLTFESWATAPNRLVLGDGDDPLRDWRPRLPWTVVKAVCEGVIGRPARAYAADAAALITRFAPDVVVSNELLFGVMIAAEATNTPLALLTSNVWCFPTRADQPPFGPGFPPARTAFEARREMAARQMIARWYDVALTDLNPAREAFELKPLEHALDQLTAADRILLGVSRAFDYDAAEPPRPFVYVGPLGRRPAWAQTSSDEAGLIDPSRPNVLVSFSTTHQGQSATVKRVVRALAGLDVHAILTLGPALKSVALPRAANVTVVEKADHDVLAPLCDLMICHGGHGTVLRPLLHGKPVLVIPTGRDQPDNAARIAFAGAGIRLPRWSGVRRIRNAVARILSDSAYASAARDLAPRLARDNVGPERAVEVLEALATSAAGSPGGSLREAG